jgi:hypothetical protein
LGFRLTPEPLELSLELLDPPVRLGTVVDKFVQGLSQRVVRVT